MVNFPLTRVDHNPQSNYSVPRKKETKRAIKRGFVLFNFCSLSFSLSFSSAIVCLTRRNSSRLKNAETPFNPKTRRGIIFVPETRKRDRASNSENIDGTKSSGSSSSKGSKIDWAVFGLLFPAQKCDPIPWADISKHEVHSTRLGEA